MCLYIWENCLSEYDVSILFTVANSIEEAIEKIDAKKLYDKRFFKLDNNPKIIPIDSIDAVGGLCVMDSL